MSVRRVFRVRRSDVKGDEEVVLVHLKSHGLKPLDFDLIGTDGLTPFVQKVKHNSVDRLRAKNFKGSSDEWRAILLWAFLNESPAAQYMDSIKGTELVAAVDEQRITIYVRQNISGIIQILGTVPLDRDDDQEIELFDWTSLSAQHLVEAEQKLKELHIQLEVQKETTEKLRAQMDGFVKAKEDHENLMLERFMHLLNAKKLKIRDQQRLLTGATVDAHTASQIQTARDSKTGKGRSALKRKAANFEADEAEDDFETAGTKTNGKTHEPTTDDEFPGSITPDRSDGEETDEDTGVEVTRNGNIKAQPDNVTKDEGKEFSMEIPQPRKLPFNSKSVAPPRPTAPAPKSADDDTDDEL